MWISVSVIHISNSLVDLLSAKLQSFSPRLLRAAATTMWLLLEDPNIFVRLRLNSILPLLLRASTIAGGAAHDSSSSNGPAEDEAESAKALVSEVAPVGALYTAITRSDVALKAFRRDEGIIKLLPLLESKNLEMLQARLH